MASDYWESYRPPPFMGYPSQAALDDAYRRLGFGPAGGGVLDLIAGFSPIVLPIFPELAPLLTAAKVVITGKISPTALVRTATSFSGEPAMNGVDDWGAGEFGTDYTPVDDTTIDPGFGAGGPDVDLSGALNLGTSLLSSGGGVGSLIRTAGSAQAMGAVSAVGGIALRMSSIVAGAILKLKQTLGGGGFLTAAGIASFGRKTWAALSSWSARNPSVSIISTLVGLGLTVEEAAHFISWGVTHRRKRRARGITGTDLRTTGRTIRKLTRYQQMLRTFCGGRAGGFPARHRHRVTSTR